MPNVLVFDIGGTFTRAAIYTGRQKLIDVKKIVSPNFIRYGCGESKLIEQLLELIVELADYYQSKFPQYKFGHIGISFPGPVTPDGTVLKAPTLWGPGVERIALRAAIKQRLAEYEITVINDITAAGSRYIDRYNGTFCIMTVSSGVGCKVFWNKQVLLNNKGLGGEIGHQYYQGTFSELICDCGDAGHTGAISSGRGMEKLIKVLASTEVPLYRNSPLSKISNPTTYELVKAIDSNDEFARLVLTESIKPLATAISYLYAFIGIERYIFIGGIVNSLREKYSEAMVEQLKQSMYLWKVDRKDIAEMICLGESDDDHGLIGVGRYVIENCLGNA